MFKIKFYQTILPVMIILSGLASHLSPAVAADLKIVIPATTSDILEAIDEETTELEDIIKNNVFSEVHHHALVIRELSNGLLVHSEDVSSLKLTQLKEDIKTANSMTQHLDASSRQHDKAATVEDFSKLQKALTEVRKNYAG